MKESIKEQVTKQRSVSEKGKRSNSLSLDLATHLSIDKSKDNNFFHKPWLRIIPRLEMSTVLSIGKTLGFFLIVFFFYKVTNVTCKIRKVLWYRNVCTKCFTEKKNQKTQGRKIFSYNWNPLKTRFLCVGLSGVTQNSNQRFVFWTWSCQRWHLMLNHRETWSQANLI